LNSTLNSLQKSALCVAQVEDEEEDEAELLERSGSLGLSVLLST